MSRLKVLTIIIFIIVGCVSLKAYTNMKVFEIHLIEENQELKFKLHMASIQIVDPIKSLAMNSEVYSKYNRGENN